jgi:hypothetical protein
LLNNVWFECFGDDAEKIGGTDAEGMFDFGRLKGVFREKVYVVSEEDLLFGFVRLYLLKVPAEGIKRKPPRF